MLYPKARVEAALREGTLLRDVWQTLSRISAETLIGVGRVYGGGLHKLEPPELANAPAGEVLDVLPKLTVGS